MSSERKLFTGITIQQQKAKAVYILNSQIIPRSESFIIRKKEGKLSKRLLEALKSNA